MLNIDLQNFIYGSPSRLDLIDYKKTNEGIPKKISIYRNHSFELVEHTISPYLDFAGFNVEFVYSDYDDSLSFFNLDTESDLLILWLDISRYNSNNVSEFIQSRIDQLFKIYKKPVLLALLGEHEIKTDFTIFPLNEIAAQYGEKFYDEKREPFTGTRISSKGMLEISKELGLNYIPSLLKTPLKAVVVDLDNTLYCGVLGEDGIYNIKIDEGHLRLQKTLLELKKQGFLLAIASKNEEIDVKRLFKENKNFAIKYDDFSKICINWDNKSSSIKKIANFFNIGYDSILFIDDNPGELAEVESVLPNVKKLLANENGNTTTEILRNYPGIKHYNTQFEDSIRDYDIRANEKRRELQAQMTQDEYIKSLHMHLTYQVNDKNSIQRISELSNKTNQFIFSYKRYSITQIRELMNSENSAIVSASLKDDLSDSGIIGVFVGKRQGEYLLLDECFVSCRALGRGIDEILIKQGIQVLTDTLGVKKIQVTFIDGERNMPARKFANRFLSEYISSANDWKFTKKQNLIQITVNK